MTVIHLLSNLSYFILIGLSLCLMKLFYNIFFQCNIVSLMKLDDMYRIVVYQLLWRKISEYSTLRSERFNL